MRRTDSRPDDRPVNRRRHGTRRTPRLGLALALLGIVASLLTLTPSAQAQAAPTPILIVGGFTQQEGLTELYWANRLADTLEYDDYDLVEAVELRGLLIPGSASMDTSAAEVADEIEDLWDRYDRKIDIIAVSQGSPAARRALQLHPETQDMVSGFISLSGANVGIPLDHPDPQWAAMLEVCSSPPFVWQVCREMVYTTDPGETSWLRDLNAQTTSPPGDPTLGDNITYWYIYSERTTSTPPEDEGTLAYEWTTPLPGAEPRSAQQACPNNRDRYAPHAAWYPAGTDVHPADGRPDYDFVMAELVIDALKRQPLVIDTPSVTCADHPNYPSDPGV